MSIRRSVLALVAGATIGLAACSSTGASGAPGASGLTLPSSLPSINLQSAAAGLEGFCADFRDKVATTWPNVNAATAASLAPLLQTWAGKAEVATVKADITTMATWAGSMLTSGSASSPPPDVTTAFDNLKAFADSNC